MYWILFLKYFSAFRLKHVGQGTTFTKNHNAHNSTCDQSNTVNKYNTVYSNTVNKQTQSNSKYITDISLVSLIGEVKDDR